MNTLKTDEKNSFKNLSNAYKKDTAVLFIVLNKPTITEKSFREIRNKQPEKLYIAIYEKSLLSDTFEDLSHIELFSTINWNCSVNFYKSKDNLPKGLMIENSISWFFNFENEGIILEDFYIPANSFWGFCSCLLEKYRNDERIAMISGRNLLNRTKQVTGDYYFSSLTFTSGFAFWKRTWNDFKQGIQSLPELEKKKYVNKIPSFSPFKQIWMHSFRLLYNNKSSGYWRFYLTFNNIINNRLSIIPQKNLIHDIREQLPDNHVLLAEDLLEEMDTLSHPISVLPDIDADILLQSKKFNLPVPNSMKNKNTEILFLKNKLLNFTNDSHSCLKIPRIIHQVYEDLAGPPEQLLEISKSWVKKHPEWEYRFWNKHAIENFLETEFPEFIPYYRDFPFDVQRWDAIRYLILYRYGGVYADMDYECFEPLDTLLMDSTCCMGMEPAENAVTHHKKMIIGNALMASVPGHLYFKQIIQDMMSEKDNLPEYKPLVIMETTGPFMVTRIYDEFSDKSQVTLLPAELIAPLTLNEVQEMIKGRKSDEIEDKIENAFAIHYFFGSWVPQTKEEINIEQ